VVYLSPPQILDIKRDLSLKSFSPTADATYDWPPKALGCGDSSTHEAVVGGRKPLEGYSGCIECNRQINNQLGRSVLFQSIIRRHQRQVKLVVVVCENVKKTICEYRGNARPVPVSSIVTGIVFVRKNRDRAGHPK